MNRQCVLVAVITCAAFLTETPASAAPREIEDFCFERLQHATLALRRGAGKAFMANCIADLTPTLSPGRLMDDGSAIPRLKRKARSRLPSKGFS